MGESKVRIQRKTKEEKEGHGEIPGDDDHGRHETAIQA